MMKETILDLIYNAINVEEKADNPFETSQTNTPYEAFYEEYIKPFEKTDLTRCNDMWLAFGEALCAERERAFKVGYTTAIKQIFSILAER